MLFYKFGGGGQFRQYIDSDMEQFLKYQDIKSKNQIEKLIFALKLIPFRNVFYYRCRNNARFVNLIMKLMVKFAKKLAPESRSIEIAGDIGPGLQISHNFSVIMPQKAGCNLRVGPGVVIGRNGHDFPVIGDNCYIASNSVVIGKIKIGNNCIVGAGAVVTKNIPDNTVVVGNPAKILRHTDSIEDVKIELTARQKID